MTTVLIVHQYSGVTSYYLKAHPEPFDTFVKRVTAQHGPLLTMVHENFQPEFMTTVIRANKHGNAEVWKTNWDKQ